LSEHLKDDKELKSMKSLERFLNLLIKIIAICSTAFFLYTAVVGILPALQQRSFLLLSALLIIFLQSMKKRVQCTNFSRIKLGIDGVFVLGSLLSCGYLFINWQSLIIREGSPILIEYFLGGFLIIALLEACRRVFGWSLPIIGAVFIIYAYVGPYLPSLLSHRGISTERLLAHSYITTQGIWGTPVAVVATVVIFFIIFTAFLTVSGASDFFIKFAQSLVGRVRGGPAKIAVVSSSLMGTLSGSAVANVVASGSVTIPLMKKVGYSPRFSAAVEAVASSGGQLMPPILGTAAFVMAEVLGVSYWNIVLASIIPAIIYYATAYIVVDLEAGKLGLKGLKKSEVPKFGKTFTEGGHLLLPILVLVVLVSMQYSPMRSALFAIITLILVSYIRKGTRISFEKAMNAIANAAIDIAPISVAVAIAGLIIGIIELTGLGLQLSNVLVTLSQGSLIGLLILTMIASLILGMGLPTVACYILLALTVAPTLISMGVNEYAAHFFVFYFGIVSAITPPIALASFAAASLSGSDPIKTAVTSLRLGIAAFLLPFLFVFEPALLLQGSWVDAIQPTITALIGVYAISIATTGYFMRRIGVIMRIVFAAVSIFLIIPGTLTDVIGGTLIILLLLHQWINVRRSSQYNSNIVNEFEEDTNNGIREV
jgi:TRAP transporter 4TM/12TM fusion protein